METTNSHGVSVITDALKTTIIVPHAAGKKLSKRVSAGNSAQGNLDIGHEETLSPQFRAVLGAAVSCELEEFSAYDLKRWPTLDKINIERVAQILSIMKMKRWVEGRYADPPYVKQKVWKLTVLGRFIARPLWTCGSDIILPDGTKEPRHLTENRILALCYWSTFHNGCLHPSWIEEVIKETYKILSGYCGTASSPAKGKWHVMSRLSNGPHENSKVYHLLQDKGLQFMEHVEDWKKVFEKAKWPFPSLTDVRRSWDKKMELAMEHAVTRLGTRP